jgi:D-alanine-D-alanine ligase
MRVGLTYDLRADYEALGLAGEEIAEFDTAETVDEVEGALLRQGCHPTVDRIGNVWRLTERLAKGERWDLVFNIAEGLRGRSREAQVPALLEAFAIPYTFGDPLVMAATLDKAAAKRIARDHGVPTAPFAVVARPDDAARVDLPYPVFAKPVAEGTGKGITPRSKATCPRELAAVCARLLARYRQPVLVEPFLPGREFTVGILGGGGDAEPPRVLGVLEIELLAGAEPEIYSYVNKERCEELVRYRLVDDAGARAAAAVALGAYRALEVVDAGRVDVRCDAAGAPMFLEVNPLPGLHPTHSDLPILACQVGMAYDELIGGILRGAAARHGLDARGGAELPRAAE